MRVLLQASLAGHQIKGERDKGVVLFVDNFNNNDNKGGGGGLNG